MIEKQQNDEIIKKEKNVTGSKITFKLMLLRKI